MQQTIIQLCAGMSNPFEHEMRDACWNCAPYWGKFPACPIHKTMIKKSDGDSLANGEKGKCKQCKKFYIYTR